MIYELITPSDAITFIAYDDKIAYTCALTLGEGKAGCENKTKGNNLQTLMLFNPEPLAEAKKYLGVELTDFIGDNKEALAECFESFAYGSTSDRQTYEDALEAITDPEKLKEFKAKHEDKNRTSMNQWVKGAWNYGEALRKKIAQDAN